MPRRDAQNRLSSRLFRALLKLFPKEFRVAHQRDMEQVFRDQQRDAKSGGRGDFGLWLVTAWGTLRAAPAEHLRIFAADAAYALRRFRKNPGMTAVAVFTVAIGIGATTAVFSLVDHVLLRPLPYAEPERLVHLVPLLDGEESIPGPVFRDLSRETRVFSGLFSMTGLGSTTISGDGGPERVRRLVVSSNYFDALGTPPLLGRTFTADDEHFTPPEVMRRGQPEEMPIGPLVISYSLWQRRFGGERDVLGSWLDVGGRPYEIIGVLPADFRVLASRVMNLDAHRDLWYLSDFNPAGFPRDIHYLEVMGRLQEGVTLSEAQAAVDIFCALQRALYPELAELDYRIRVEPLHRQVVGHVAQPLWTLFGAVTLVLLIACANVASLMLAGGATRQGELGMRVALGASRERLVRQLMTESTLIAAAGAALGLALAFFGLDAAMALRPDSLQRFEGATIDGRMLFFALTGTVLSAVVFGTLPSLRYSKPRLEHALAAGRKSLGGLLRKRNRGLVVAGEIALSFVLLAGTGLLVRSLMLQLERDPGFEPGGVSTAFLHLPRGYPERTERMALYREMHDRLAEIPGVETVGFASNVPFDAAGGHTTIATERAPDSEFLIWDVRVAPGFFRALGIPLRAGRLPEWRDMADPDRPFALVDEALAARLWPGESAVGQRLRVPRLDFTGDDDVANQIFSVEVIGVVARIHDDSLAVAGPETLYLGLNFTPPMTPMLVVRANTDAAGLEPAVRETLRQIDDQIAAATFRDMRSWLGDATANLDFTMRLLGVFGFAGLLLAAVGLYALLAHSVRRGAGEIGLRMALGAEPAGVLRIVLMQGVKLTILGLGLGVLAALALGRVLEGQLFGVSAQDPLTLAAVAALFALTAILACSLPARRALRVDPLVALRAE